MIDIKRARYEFMDNALNANDWAYKYALDLLTELEQARTDRTPTRAQVEDTLCAIYEDCGYRPDAVIIDYHLKNLFAADALTKDEHPLGNNCECCRGR